MIGEARLKNGIRVKYERMESIRSTAIGVWVGAGSRHERPNSLGISHFIEHMLFKGTKKRTAKQIAEEIDYVGGQINAFTAKDYTCYYTKTLDSHIGLAADILSDIMMRSKLLKSDINLERNVILEEINMYEDSPDELVHDLLSETVWKNSPLGNPILGRPSTLANIDRAAMRDYMQERYAPGNIVISAAGSLEEKEFAAILEDRFGRLGAKKAAAGGGDTGRSGGGDDTGNRADGIADAERGDRADGDTDGEVEYEAGICLKRKETEQIHLCIGFDGIELGNDDIYALNLANNMFGGGMSSILFQKIREDLGLVYSIYSYVSAYKNAGLYAIYAGMQPENAERVFDLIVGEINAFKKEGLSADLLNKAKEQFKGGFYMGLENPNARMSALGKSELLLGHINTPDEIVEKIEKVTVGDIFDVIRRTFDLDKMSICAAGRIGSGFESALTDAGRRMGETDRIRDELA